MIIINNKEIVDRYAVPYFTITNINRKCLYNDRHNFIRSYNNG